MPRAGQPLINTSFVGLPCGRCCGNGAAPRPFHSPQPLRGPVPRAWRGPPSTAAYLTGSGLCRAHGAASGRLYGCGSFRRRGASRDGAYLQGKMPSPPLERALLRALSEAALLFSGAGVSGTSSSYIRPTCTAVSCRSTKRKAPSTGSCPFRVSRRKRNRTVHACCRVRFAL